MEGAMTSRTHETPAYPTLEPILDVIANWVKKYRYAVGLRNELARCGPDEIARAARDLGVSPGELGRLASKGPHAADQLPKLLRALGVDPKKLSSGDPAMMRDLQRLCITCGQKGRCEHELAAGTAARNFRDFCPNAISLDALFKAA
jgi:hypothetical protein